ncbi:MAG: hypothetical protein ACUVTM_06935 [Candidatus Bathyarchaeia archaeon]
MSRKAGDLSWRLNRFLRNLAFRLKIFRIPKTLKSKPPVNIVTLFMMAFAIFILAGGVYSFVEVMSGRSLTMLPRAGGWTFIYPGNLNMQTISESLISGIMYFLGGVGVYLLLRSVRLAYRPRQAYLTLILGLILTLIVAYYSSSLLQSKIAG